MDYNCPLIESTTWSFHLSLLSSLHSRLSSPMDAVDSPLEKTAIESPSVNGSTPLLDQTPVPGIQRIEEEGVAITWKYRNPLKYSTLSLRCRNLAVTTVAGRPLLRSVNGIAVPGMMTALMGARWEKEEMICFVSLVDAFYESFPSFSSRNSKEEKRCFVWRREKT